MSYKTILMAVEPDFNISHIGVLRVIRYHFKALVARGHSVTLATYQDGAWVSCSQLDAARAILDDARHAAAERPYWQSGAGALPAPPDPQATAPKWTIAWNGPIVTPAQFDASILTNPWMCAQDGVPIADSPFSMGIVYDMVPNLIALGILRMPQFIDIYEFAHAHHIGYDYYLRNAATISCISASTRQDFTRLYGATDRTAVCIPFDDFGAGVAPAREHARDVLMINVLDHRKNFRTVARTLQAASAHARLHVVIVGRERLPREEVMQFLADIAAVCASVRWYRSPTDVQLQALMASARVVFFPSFYEGLGLPILEAQACGVPVISSFNSSCGEINMNPVLTADAYDVAAFAAMLVDLLDHRLAILEGAALRAAQSAFLQDKNALFVAGAGAQHA